MRIPYGNFSRRIDTTPVMGPSPVLFFYDFIANTTLPTDLSLSRATTGTRFNSSGVLVSEAIDVARFEISYNGSGGVASGLRY